jgi:glycosyltransferase involved in cell wall biosynthesis
LEVRQKRVLVISYYYPPLGGAGVLKILRTTRYLGKYGWTPLVLTVKNPEPYHRAANPIPEGVKVYRALRIPGGNFLARAIRRFGLDERWLLLPDQHVFWLPGAFLYGLYLSLHQKIDLIYVSGPPYSALMAGAWLKIFTGKPLVVDIRDPWSFNAARAGYPSKFHRLMDRAFEKWALRRADFITCIYRITETGYHRLYDWTHDKTAVFYDTIDPADLPERVEPYSIFTLTYLGTFYPPFAGLKATLRALKILLEQGAIEPAGFCFNYVGPADYTFERLVAELGIGALVRRTGYLPLKEAQLEAARSQCLLLLLEFATINTKLFDYLAAGQIILAVVPEFQELEELLEKYAVCYYRITNNDYLAIADKLKEWYHDFYHDGLKHAPEKLELFRREMNIETETKDLAAIFDAKTQAKGKSK